MARLRFLSVALRFGESWISAGTRSTTATCRRSRAGTRSSTRPGAAPACRRIRLRGSRTRRNRKDLAMAEVGGEEAVERGGDRQSLVDGAVAGVVDRDARALNVVRWRRAELRRPAGDDPILAREEKSGRLGGLVALRIRRSAPPVMRPATEDLGPGPPRERRSSVEISSGAQRTDSREERERERARDAHHPEKKLPVVPDGAGGRMDRDGGPCDLRPGVVRSCKRVIQRCYVGDCRNEPKQSTAAAQLGGTLPLFLPGNPENCPPPRCSLTPHPPGK